MLERPDLVCSPIALSKVVELLQAMLSPQLDPRRRALGGVLPKLASCDCWTVLRLGQNNSPELQHQCWSSARVACNGGASHGAQDSS